MKILNCLLVTLLFAAAAYSQLLLGTISGTVTDSQGALIPSAKVEVQNIDTNLKVSAQSQSNGLYQVPNLPAGTYKVTVRHDGFESKVFTSILVQANRTSTVDAQLTVGQVTTSVEVTGTPLRNETDTTNGYVLDSHTIENTPLGTGSFTQLAILSPGLNADFLAGSGTNAGLGNQNIWANGQRDTSNSFSINAVSTNNLFNGKSSSQVTEIRYTLNTGQFTNANSGNEIQTNMTVYNAIGQGMPTPAPEALQELRVNSSQYDATQGGNSGAQIAMITRSGTNEFHGQLYDYLQNKAFNAAPFFRNADPAISAHDKVPALHYNRFGATIGGPIVRDKVFFFAAYQGIRNNDALGGNSKVTVPQHLTDDRSPAALAAVGQQDFGVSIAPSAIDPVALKTLQAKVNGNYLIPSATVTDSAVAKQLNYNALISGPPSVFMQDQINANVDWNFSSKDRLAAKYFSSDNPNTNPFGQSTVLGFPQHLEAGSWVASVSNTYVVRPNLTWEQRVGVSRQRTMSTTSQALTPADIGMNLFGGDRFPTLQIFQADGVLRSGLIIGPRNVLGNAGSAQNRGTWSSNANWIVGRHTLYFGFSMDLTQLNVVNRANQVAAVESQTFADFLKGAPLNTSFSFLYAGASNRYYRAWQAGGYMQDNFKMRSNLSLSLGIRYDLNGPFWEKYGVLANFHPDAYHYDPASDTVTNAGIVIAGNNPTLGTKGVANSTLTGGQSGIGPRVGLAWSPSRLKKVTVRAGFGLYYDRGEYFSYLSPGSGPGGTGGPFGVTLQLPFVSRIAATSAGTLDLPFGSAPPPPPTNPNAITALLPNIAKIKNGASTYVFGGYDSANTLPYTENWSLDLQWQPLNSWLLSVGYVGNHGVHQVLPIPFNQPSIATPDHPINLEQYSYGFNMIPNIESLKTFDGGNTSLRVPFLGYSTNSVLYKTIGISTYNSLQVGLRKRLAHGLQLTASYTWSHSLDEQSGLGLFYNGNDPTSPHLSYGNSSYDRTHVFIASYFYEIPNVVKSKAWFGQATNGWQLSGVVTAQSGQPYNFYDFSGAVAGQYYSSFVSILDPIIGFQPGVTTDSVKLQGTTGVNPAAPLIDLSKLYTPTIAPGVNGVPPCATVSGSQVCDTVETGFANSGRNVFRGPFQSRMDTAVSKAFRISERFKLRYSAEFYNITNHPSFDVPNNNPGLYSVSSGKVTVRTPSATTGMISHTIGSPRFIQMSLRLQF